jgi:serine phosphatase RsbU (regulator of sigma subunit)
LPSERLISELLPNSFVLYLPKDVVAGDFYWLEKTENEILFAVADCTGHGVPGAMVSVVCNNALNRVVKEYKLTIPGEILDKTRSLIIEEFEKSEEEVKDGMDIALCSIVGDKLSYAGAHNPLVIIRNGELIEVKANKQPIGKYDKIQAFTTHEVQLQKGDRIYLFSDGYIDQFGGEFGKKLKSKYFKEILLNNQNKSIENQKDAFESAFQNWKGNYEQIDDVCLIGIEF